MVLWSVGRKCVWGGVPWLLLGGAAQRSLGVFCPAFSRASFLKQNFFRTGGGSLKETPTHCRLGIQEWNSRTSGLPLEICLPDVS